GRDVASWLQKKRPDLPVVFTSGYTTDFAGRELELKEHQSFLQKPAPPAEILAAVRAALDR
ncbi:MAG TPA: response regulator, partial [Vicinamibacterales bacterium]|nr:response regulator [Vicinamibacterales bacterium]